MSLKITELGVVIPGQVIRKYDTEANATTLVMSEAQVRDAYESLGTAVQFFESQARPQEPVSGDLADGDLVPANPPAAK